SKFPPFGYNLLTLMIGHYQPVVTIVNNIEPQIDSQLSTITIMIVTDNDTDGQYTNALRRLMISRLVVLFHSATDFLMDMSSERYTICSLACQTKIHIVYSALFYVKSIDF
ncbi:MAG TPA: hypothetical protein VN922_21690, partial [Bacteroidia bacterium]|nr:hypothetical protein [Bacteroidia bacterium]